MKLQTLTVLSALSTIVFTGCVSPDGMPDHTGTGALTGGAIGATSGAIIGSAGGRSGEGALIGAAVGVIAGGLIGHSLDQEQQVRLRQQAPQTYVHVDQGQPLTVADVTALAKAGVSDEVIINQIRSTRTVYRLAAADIINLHNDGVSENVINFMISTPSVIGAAPVQPPVLVAQPPPPPRVETVVVAPGPGYLWIGGEWIWRGGWVWIGGHWGFPPRPHAVWVPSYWVRRGPHGWGRVPGHWG